MKVLIAGGGTGGHIYPGVTLARALQEKGAEILFVGTRQGLESRIVPREGFPIEYITVDYFPRRLSLRLVRSLWRAGRGVREAFGIVRRYAPDICIGTGGYVAGPVVLAAAVSGRPTLIQEQNAYPGLTNRWLVHVVDKVALGYDEARRHFRRKDKLVVTGNPIRPEIVGTSRAEGAARLGFSTSGRVVLVFGASQGARSINQALLASLPDLHRLDARFLVVTGMGGFQPFIDECIRRGYLGEAPPADRPVEIKNVRVVPYLYDMPAALAVADLVVCRASAGSIAEVTAKGIPAILIPYPHAAENHQEKNARVLEEKGAAVVINDADLDGERLYQSISSLLMDSRRRARMAQAGKAYSRPDAVWDIVALVEAMVSQTMAR